MYKAVANGVFTSPKFAVAEVSGGGNNIVYAGSEYLMDKDGNYVDESGNIVSEENKIENPYGFKIIADSNSSNIYKLYNNGDLYGKGIKSFGLDSSKSELDAISPYTWKKFNLPSTISSCKKIIPGYSTLFVIDNNENLWAVGDSISNKLGLNEDQTKEYTEREFIKLEIKENDNLIRVDNVFSFRECTYVLSKDGVLYACGRNTRSDSTTQTGILGVNSDEMVVSSFEKVQGIDSTKKIKKVFGDEKWQQSTMMFCLCDDGTLYKSGNRYCENSTEDTGKIFYEIISPSELEDVIVDVDCESISRGLIAVLNNGKVYRIAYNNSSHLFEGTLINGIDNMSTVTAMKAGRSYFLKDKNNKFYFYKGNSVKEAGFSEDDFVDNEGNKKEILDLNEYFKAKFGNDTIKDIEITGDSVGDTIYYIMQSGKIYGIGDVSICGVGEEIVNSHASGTYSDIILVNNSTDISNKTITGQSNNLVAKTSFSYPMFLCDSSDLFITGNQSLMYGNDIIQSNWKKIASDVKAVFLGSEETIGIIDKNCNGFVSMRDFRDIGINSISENVIKGNNFREITVEGLKGNVKEFSFNYGASFVLNNDGDLYGVGKGKFDSTWVAHAYNGISDEANTILKKFDSGVLSISSGTSRYVGTTTIYLKNDGIYYIGIGTGAEYHGFSNSTGGSQPVKKTVDNFIPSKITKFVNKWGQITYLSEDGDLWLGGIGYQRVYDELTTSVMGKFNYSDFGISSKIIDFAICNSSLVVLTETKEIYGIGLKKYLGIGSNSSAYQSTFKDLKVENVSQICATKDSFVIVKKDGTVWGTGSNKYGVLGRWRGIDRESSNSRYKTALNWVECPDLEI